VEDQSAPILEEITSEIGEGICGLTPVIVESYSRACWLGVELGESKNVCVEKMAWLNGS
jgi:hypothetical protein